MTITKAELNAINARLHERIRRLKEENAACQAQNHGLRETLERSRQRMERMTRRYRMLADYLQRLRALLRETRNARR